MNDSCYASVYAVIPAAGSGTRMGTETNKQLLPVAGVPVLVRTLLAFDRHEAIEGIVVVAREEECDLFREIITPYGLTTPISIVPGGANRQASVRLGLEYLATKADETSLVLVHDGARCFVDQDILDRCLEGLRAHMAITAAVPVIDTLALAEPQADGGEQTVTLQAVPDRSRYWQIQTPQGFRLGQILAWHSEAEANGLDYTDDSSLAKASGEAVGIVMGSYRNVKITTATDLLLAQAFLA